MSYANCSEASQALTGILAERYGRVLLGLSGAGPRRRGVRLPHQPRRLGALATARVLVGEEGDQPPVRSLGERGHATAWPTRDRVVVALGRPVGPGDAQELVARRPGVTAPLGRSYVR